jgi:hypothetical protein
MTTLADELRAALVARLHSCKEFSDKVKGKIATTESSGYPSVWVGVTQQVEHGEFLATVHVWTREGRMETVQLARMAADALKDIPATKNLHIFSWLECYSEVRMDEESEAFHGLARFRGKTSETNT